MIFERLEGLIYFSLDGRYLLRGKFAKMMLGGKNKSDFIKVVDNEKAIFQTIIIEYRGWVAFEGGATIANKFIDKYKKIDIDFLCKEREVLNTDIRDLRELSYDTKRNNNK